MTTQPAAQPDQHSPVQQEPSVIKNRVTGNVLTSIPKPTPYVSAVNLQREHYGGLNKLAYGFLALAGFTALGAIAALIVGTKLFSEESMTPSAEKACLGLLITSGISSITAGIFAKMRNNFAKLLVAQVKALENQPPPKET